MVDDPLSLRIKGVANSLTMRPFVLAVLVCSAAYSAPVSTLPGPFHLRADGVNILDVSLPSYALGTATPRFEWAQSTAQSTRGATQSSFRIVVRQLRTGEEDLPVWDSGVVMSSTPAHTYDGAPLQPGGLYEWRVSTTLSGGVASALSEPGQFRVSLLSDADWTSPRGPTMPWLGDKPEGTLNLYRATFPVGALPKDAVFYVCGLGYSSVRVNGVPVPKMRLVTAPWTPNERFNGFSAIDILGMLKPNANNTITVGLGSGWRDQTKFQYKDSGELKGDKTMRVLRAQLRTSPSDVLLDTAGEGWQAATGPVKFDSVYDGEHYDARDEDEATLQWEPAPVLDATDSPQGAMLAWTSPPVEISRELAPVSIEKYSTDLSVVDFGANLAGVVQLTALQGCREGDSITMVHGEIMQHAGIPGLPNPDPKRVYTGNLRSAQATDIYTCSGKPGGETWSPRFTYHGFRFVEVSTAHRDPTKPPPRAVLTLTLTLPLMCPRGQHHARPTRHHHQGQPPAAPPALGSPAQDVGQVLFAHHHSPPADGPGRAALQLHDGPH